MRVWELGEAWEYRRRIYKKKYKKGIDKSEDVCYNGSIR